MNRWLYNIGLLLLSMSMFFLSACSDEVISRTEPIPGGDKEIPLVISLNDLSGVSTYGTNYPGTLEGGSTWENAINDITVYIFNQSFECEKIMTATSSPTDTVMVKTGTKNIVAVVNAVGKITLPATEAATSYPNLLKMLTNASAVVPSSPFLMTGKALDVSLPSELPISSPHNVTIDVERTVAKVKLKVMKSGLALSHDITLTKVYMYQGADRVALLETPSPNSTIYNLSDTANVFQHTITNVFSGAVPNSGSGYCAMVDSFYTYESLCGSDKSKAVKIVLESYVNSPANVRTAEFYLAEHSVTPGDTTYNVKRNHWYDVTVNIVKPGMDSIYVTVKSCPWNLTDTIEVIEGEGAEYPTAQPFKLVKNYTAADTVIASNCAEIDTHTKGASWIDLKVSSGTTWALKLKDNTARNQNVIGKIIGNASWTNMVHNGTHLSGIGTDATQRIYIYRLYQENAEPDQGPTLYLEVGGKYKADFVIQPRDTMPIPTNSYILRPQLSGVPTNATRAYIPLAGVYRYWEDYLMANGDSIPGGNATPITAQVMWKDNAGTVINSVDVINANKRDSAYIYVEAGAVQGNAVVAMRVGGVTFWSFHIWVTEYNPYEAAGQKLYSYTKNIFMDRNLGALSNSYDAAGDARGLYYQYGRKDPFPRGTAWGSSFATSFTAATQPSAASGVRPLTAVPASIQNPMTFYTRGSADWALSKENNNLWSTTGGNKTALDPCPEGWRIPKQESYGSTESPWNLVDQTNLVTGIQSNGRYSAMMGYFPFSGYVTNASSITGTTTAAYYWSSWGDFSGYPNQGSGLSITNSAVSVTPLIDKAYGASVRCIVDLNYLLTVEGGGLFGSGGGSMIEEIIP